MEAPDIGTAFTYRGGQYVVTSWLKPTANPRPLARRFTTDDVPVMFCTRDEAVYVGGRGVCGCIAPISDVEITGKIDWAPEIEQYHREHAQRLAANREQVF